MTDTPAHTPLPWMVSPILPTFIMSADGKADICELDGWPVDYVAEENANREFIVRACNSHYQLVEALREARSGLCAYTGGEDGACSETIARIDAALSQAGGASE